MTYTLNMNAAAKKSFETIASSVPVIGQMLGVFIELFWPQSQADNLWKQVQDMNVKLNLDIVATDVNTIESDIDGMESAWRIFLTNHNIVLPKTLDSDTPDSSGSTTDTQPDLSSLTINQLNDLAAFAEKCCLDFDKILSKFHKAPPEYLTGHLLRLGNLTIMTALLQRQCWDKLNDSLPETQKRSLVGLDYNIKNWALLFSVLLRACICRTRYVRVIKKQWYNAAGPNGVVTLADQRDRFEIVPDIDGSWGSLRGGDYPNDNKGKISKEPATTAIVDNHLIQMPSDSGGMAGSIVFLMAEGTGFDPNAVNDHVDKLTRYAEQPIYKWLDNGIILDSLIAWETRAMMYDIKSYDLATNEQHALQAYLNRNCQNSIPFYLQTFGDGAWNDGVLSCPAIADPIHNDSTCANRLGKWVTTGTSVTNCAMSSDESTSPRRCADGAGGKVANFSTGGPYWKIEILTEDKGEMVGEGPTLNMAIYDQGTFDDYAIARIYPEILIPAVGGAVYFCDPYPVNPSIRYEIVVNVCTWSAS